MVREMVDLSKCWRVGVGLIRHARRGGDGEGEHMHTQTADLGVYACLHACEGEGGCTWMAERTRVAHNWRGGSSCPTRFDVGGDEWGRGGARGDGERERVPRREAQSWHWASRHAEGEEKSTGTHQSILRIGCRQGLTGTSKILIVSEN